MTEALPQRPGARLRRMAPFAAIAVAVLVALATVRPYAVGVFHDDGVYVILAKSIATGQGYRFLHLPGVPAAVHYPPGYPLLLSVLWRAVPAFPQNVMLFLLVNVLLLGVTAWGMQRLATRVLGWTPAWAAVAAVIATVSLPMLMLSGAVLSEPLFVALLFPALVASERLVATTSPRTPLRLVGVALLAGALCLVRTHGAALVVALVGTLVMRRRRRDAAVCALVVAAALAPWQLWVAAHDAAVAESLRGSYGSYQAWLAAGASQGGAAFVVTTVMHNLRELVQLLADRFSLHDSVGVRALTAYAALLAVAVGAWAARRRAPVTVAFTVVYVGVLVVWPYTPWRFFFAIWPIVVLAVGEAARWAADRLATTHGRPAPLALAALVGVLALGAVREEARVYRRRAWAAPAVAATLQIAPLVRWVEGHTSPGDIVAVDGEQLVYLFTGRQALPIAPFTAAEYLRPRTVAENATSLRGLLADFPVSYVLTISPALRESALQLALATPGGRGAHLVPLDSTGGAAAFRVERAP